MTAILQARSINRARGLFVGIQALHALALSFFFGSGNIWVFLLSGAGCLASYRYLLPKEFRQHPLVLTPMVLLLLSGMIRLGLVPLWAFGCALQGYEEAFNFVGRDARPWIIEGQFLLVLGDALFVAGYALFQKFFRPRMLPRSLKGIEPGLTAYCTIAVISPLIAVNLVAPGLLAALGRIGNYFTDFGLIAVILLMLLSRRVGRPVPWSLIGVIFTIALANSLRSYMKQSTIVLVLPIVLMGLPMAYQRLRSQSKTWFYSALGAGVLISGIGMAWLFSYSEIRRADVWGGSAKARYSIDASEVPILPAAAKATLSLLPWTEESAEFQRMPDRGIWSFFNRHADAFGAGWTFNAKAVLGTMDGQFIHTGLISIIPRILWPEKPEISQGRTVAVLLGQARTEETATTATSLGGMAAFLFMDLGWPWLIAGMAMSGAMFALVSYIFLPRLLTNPFAAIACAGLFVDSIRHFESAADAGIANYAYPLIVLLPMALMWELIFPNGRQTKLSRASHA